MRTYLVVKIRLANFVLKVQIKNNEYSATFFRNDSVQEFVVILALVVHCHFIDFHQIFVQFAKGILKDASYVLQKLR